jgi:hypothetical protein
MDQMVETLFQIRTIVGDHIGAIESRIGPELGILQQTGGSDGQGIGHLGQVIPQFPFNPAGEMAIDEKVGDLLIRQIRFGQIAQPVVFDKGFKSVGGNYQGLGNQNIDPFE